MSGLLFGVSVAASTAPEADPAREARTAEQLGFDFVSAPDHPFGSSPTNETWTTLVWMAASTSRIGIASRVLGVPFRRPSMVAKMAETLDRLSGGRLILGLGAGAADDKMHSIGVPVPPPRDKIAGLEEAVGIIRGLWTEPLLSHAGDHHHTDGAVMEPKPTRPIPIWLGTFGDRALAVTGRLADGWLPFLRYAPAERLGTMRRRVVSAAEGAGRDPGEIVSVLNVETHVGTEAEPRAGLISGPPEQVAERLAEFVGMGFVGFNFMPVGADSTEQLHRIGTELLPLVRSTA